jgi:hypothetical protein
MFFSKKEWELSSFRKSKTRHKKYDAIIENRDTGKLRYIPFGDNRYQSFHDKTGLDLYETHGDKTRQKNYRARHRKDIRTGFFSPGYFSYYMLW